MGSPVDDRKTGLGDAPPRSKRSTEILFLHCQDLLHVQAGSQKTSFALIQRQFSRNVSLEYGHFQSSPTGWKSLAPFVRDMCNPSDD